MPQERNNPYPFLSPEEIAAIPGTREQKAARFVAARHILGLFRNPYLKGECYHASILRGIADLSAAAFRMLDADPLSEEFTAARLALTAILDGSDLPQLEG